MRTSQSNFYAPKYRAEAKARAKQYTPIIRELQRDGLDAWHRRRAGEAQGANTTRRLMASAACEARRGTARCWDVSKPRHKRGRVKGQPNDFGGAFRSGGGAD
jgi:hypothetical protein